jgi:hypothetical protein
VRHASPSSSGKARALEEVMERVTHRPADSPIQELLAHAGNQPLMVNFLMSIDPGRSERSAR